MMVIVIGMVAFAIDSGYIALAKTEAQRTADATAHAGAVELIRTQDISQAVLNLQQVSDASSAGNPVLGIAPKITRGEDIIVGRYDFGSGQTELLFGDTASYNAVQARVRRTEGQNGVVSLFFGKIFGRSGQEVESEAIAAVVRNVSGFKIPASGENAPMLPITVSLDYWNRAFGSGGDDDHDDGSGNDDWGYDAENKTVYQGADGKSELNVFPNQSGSSGNLGTVNIGIDENSASFISKQIRVGITSDDMDYHGGSLQMDSSGSLPLTGNPGLSASLQNDLASLAGQVRVILIHDNVKGGGNNATFNVVRFQAVRIMAANLSGGDKAVAVQPASLQFDGVIQGSSAGASNGVFSSIQIVN